MPVRTDTAAVHKRKGRRLIGKLNIYEKKGIILLAQEDHLDGEIVGSAIEELYRAGAYNVQVIATVTKKNRPGHLFVVDCGEGECGEVEQVLLRELGVTGWHKLETGHRHVGTEIRVYPVTFETPHGPALFQVKVKAVKHQTGGLRPEHSSCVEIREELGRQNVYLPLREIRQKILQQLH